MSQTEYQSTPINTDNTLTIHQLYQLLDLKRREKKKYKDINKEKYEESQEKKRRHKDTGERERRKMRESDTSGEGAILYLLMVEPFP